MKRIISLFTCAIMLVANSAFAMRRKESINERIQRITSGICKTITVGRI